MPKVLVLETTMVNYHDDRGGVVAEAGTLIAVDAAQALTLARFGRVLYTTKGDDPTKGQLTAPGEVIELAEEHAQELAAVESPTEKFFTPGAA